MKKIIAVIGSPKTVEQSKTAKLAMELVEQIHKGTREVEAEILSLGDRNLQMCKGCMTCGKTGSCPLKDDMEEIRMKLKQADLIIFGSPVHISHVSGTFQNFLDRMYVGMHIFELIGKPCIQVITTNGSGEQETEKYMNQAALLLGMIRIGTLVRMDSETFDAKKLVETADKARLVLSDKSRLKASLMNSVYFWSMKKIIRENEAYFEFESRVWKEKGWFGSNFKRALKAIY